MSTRYSIRYAISPNELELSSTEEIREHFLIDDLFEEGVISLACTHYDRFIVGSAVPAPDPLALETIEPLKSDYFLQRREMGVINVGEAGQVVVDGERIDLDYKEALYIGMGARQVSFESSGDGTPLFYINSAPAHRSFPVTKVDRKNAEFLELGSMESSNHRVIRKLIVSSTVQTCQLQMGMTELEKGSVWNTMPVHVHDRRMEAYLYFELPDDQVVCHFLGEPQQTRHLWIKNRQAVLSPPWSIHSGSGTSNYTFLWGMAGENLDYTDMEVTPPVELR